METVEVVNKLKPIYQDYGFDSPTIEFSFDNLKKAIYILEDGTLIHGGFFQGYRSIDHRIIEALYDDMDRYTEDFWDVALDDIGAAMIVPENRMILRWENQTYTEKQEILLDVLKENYSYTEYVEPTRSKSSRDVFDAER